LASQTDEALLHKVALEGATAKLRQVAAEKITDKAQLQDLLKESKGKDKAVYKIAKDKCDQFKEEEINKINAEIEEAKTNAKLEIDDIKQGQQAEIQEIKLTHQLKIDELNRKNEMEIAEILQNNQKSKEDFTSDIYEAQKNATETIRKIKEETAVQIKLNEEVMKQKQATIDSLQLIINDLNEKLNKEKKKNE